MSIRPLPEDVVGKIRSSSTITSLNGVVCGLLKNSLDAGATKVNVYVEYGRGNCTVEDNGPGIVPGDFAEDGGLGKPYYSSKFPAQQGLHGRQGTFLASLGTLSLLTVTSHHQRHNSHNSLSIHHGKLLKRQTQSFSGERFDVFDHGTRVAVNDLFGSLPVRVKHRATLFADRPGRDKEWARLIHDVVGLLVAWSSGVTVFLCDIKGQRELRLKPPENASMVPRALRYFVQASLADSGEMDSWVPVSATAGHVAIKGCISLTPVATRRSQFMSIGILPISNEYGNNVLYEEVNKMFKNSDFGIDEGKIGETGDRAGPISQKKGKGADRWPIFYLRITLKGSEDSFDMDDISSHSHGDLQKIIDLLRAMTYSFLKKNHMRPQKVQLSSDKSVFSTAPHRSTKASKGHMPPPTQASIPPSSQALLSDSSSSLSDSPFDGWNRMKVGLRTETKSAEKLSRREPTLAPSDTIAAERLVGEGGKLLRKPFSIPDSSDPEAESINSSETGAGNVCGKGSLSLAERPKRTAEPSLSEATKRLKVGDPEAVIGGLKKTTETNEREEPSEWLQEVLKSWRNPVFEPTESLIPRINDEAPAPMRETMLVHGSHRCRNDGNGGVKFEAASIGIEGRVSRSALEGAEVIAQVDKKFIMLKLPLQDMKDASKSGSSCALVMLDQHAADERCRLEDLLTEYFKDDPSSGIFRAVVESLERPLIFETSEREYGLLQRYQGHLEAWGIMYRTTQQAAGYTITVTALPPSILERCRGEPRLLVDLIRKEIWKLHDEGIIPPRPRSAGKGTQNQISMADFHGCPRGILELLHSRACRSAIMFNDVLSAGECEYLVRKLARCAFPFQCAHGRPSLVPLVDLGSACRIRAWDEVGNAREDLKVWKRWIDA
ncbi:DNA mismatch repair protein MLH3 [Trichoderma gamsii]|uniref:DNA mismatch repair protein MLH3 n=1 Tax=Trichoderma gamsii TaxID=398673 RepID=A0A2P4ZLH4_9HYPO|nr:DNA mismatch repair protein MLH3 [Trichoderma gamsii]PON25139.1 DNA mismatch repair protein MLH3 [Trichoderma gamsii]